MMDLLQTKQYNSLKERFTECDATYHPYSFLKIKFPFDAASVKKELARKKKCGFLCVIPEFMRRSTPSPSQFEVYDAYRQIFALAENMNINIAFNLEVGYEKFILGDDGENGEELAARNLTVHSYRCTENEEVFYNIHIGSLMSIVAYDGNTDIIDLRPYVTDSVLRWTVPRGNWDILEFSCVPDLECGRINYLDYKTSLDYISTSAEELGGIASECKPTVLSALKFDQIGFIGRNRRMWTEDFNSVFEAKYGFDPSPYYPVLFYDIGKDTKRLKAQFMDCRAEMLKDGFVKAAYDYATEYNISCIGGFIEPKLSACSAVTGDTMLLNSYAPSALLSNAYLYGINSVKIAAGAAYCFDRTTVNCDVYKNYEKIDLDIAYKDAMHVFARGVNRLILHSPDFEDENAPSLLKTLMGEEDVCDFSRFVTRVQSVLKGGQHIADIALLYPIYSVHSNVYFYDYDVDGFEYPDTKTDIDYMSVINSISFYSGHDVTVVHPDAMNRFCHARNRYLYLVNGNSKEKYSVLVIPATSVISVKSLELAAEFFDCGGKIIATGELPEYAIESTPSKNYDNRVRELVSHIFGEDASSKNIMRSYCVNKNSVGGVAYMLYFSLTAADGTNMVESSQIHNALEEFDVSYDISLPEMARYESTGALNAVYPVFKKLGLSNHLPNGGMINHIHKKRGDIDIYYISNTTTQKLKSPLILKGHLNLEEWNPHTGKSRRIQPSYFTRTHGNETVTFTQIDFELDSAKSLILVGTPA